MIIRCEGPNGHTVVLDTDRVQVVEFSNGRCSAQLEDGARLDYGLPNARKLFEALEAAMAGRDPAGEGYVTVPYVEETRREATREREQKPAATSREAPGYRPEEPAPGDSAVIRSNW